MFGAREEISHVSSKHSRARRTPEYGEGAAAAVRTCTAGQFAGKPVQRLCSTVQLAGSSSVPHGTAPCDLISRPRFACTVVAPVTIDRANKGGRLSGRRAAAIGDAEEVRST